VSHGLFVDQNILYLVSGDGADKENILTAIHESGMKHRVRLLGFMDAHARELLLNTCDIFVQPNIRVPGDMEGFGISVIEAVSCELPVVASRLEGLQDAIADRESGYLVEPENPQAFKDIIQTLLSDDAKRQSFGQHARRYIVTHFDWSVISQKYLETLKKTLS
jgi:phosphatidyl-myo-inositol dimannoside synthase